MKFGTSVIVRCVLTCSAILWSGASLADVTCELSNFEVEAYDHGGVYMHGILGGTYAGWIMLCGVTSGQQDCSAKASDRRLAIALAAQAAGKNLSVYFWSLNACSEFQPYTVAAGVRMKN